MGTLHEAEHRPGKRFLVVATLVALLAPLPGCESPPTGDTEYLRLEGGEDRFVIWQGFEHAWAYNHRWNRFGNWIEPLDDCATARCFGAAHSAASGSGADTATFHSELAQVTAPGVGFTQATGEFTLSDVFPQEAPWTHVQTVRIPLADLPTDQAQALRDRSSLIGVLNGWDLYAESDIQAAKPIDFALEVDEPRYLPDGDVIEVRWRALLRMGCSTEECRGMPAFSYRIKAQLAVLAWDDELTVSARERFAHKYTWDAPASDMGNGNNPTAQELELAPIDATFPRVFPDGAALAAIQRVTLHLYHWKEGMDNADQHMLEWQSRVGAPQADGSLPLNLTFKNWDRDMNSYQPFSYEEVGAASMSAGLVLIELPDGGAVERTTWNGYHSWPGEDRSAADDNEAVTRSWEQTP